MSENETLKLSVTASSPSHPPKGNSPDRNLLKRALKIVTKMLKCISSQLMDSGEGMEKDLVIFKGLATVSLTVLQ